MKRISKSKKNLSKRKNKIGGNNCTVSNNLETNYGCNTYGMNTCIPNVNVEQYKYPCNFLPLDGTKQNVYPLSHNPKPGPPFGLTTGGKKKNLSRKNKSKKNKKHIGGEASLPIQYFGGQLNRYFPSGSSQLTPNNTAYGKTVARSFGTTDPNLLKLNATAPNLAPMGLSSNGKNLSC